MDWRDTDIIQMNGIKSSLAMVTQMDMYMRCSAKYSLNGLHGTACDTVFLYSPSVKSLNIDPFIPFEIVDSK